MTVLQLIVSSLCAIQHLAPGREPNTSEKAHALRILNRMLSSWNTERLNIYAVARALHTLVAGQSVYTIGPDGDFDVAKPIRIERAGLIRSGSEEEIPYEVLSLDRYRNGLTGVYLDNAHPVSTLRVNPEPADADVLVLYTWTPISAFASVEDEIELPEGYEEALTYNLAIRCGLEFRKPAPPEVHQLARESKMHIQSLNAPAPEMRVDPAFLGWR